MLDGANQDQGAASFPFRPTEVTRLKISGGIWNNVEGNSITLHNCKVCLTSDGRILRTISLSSTRPGSVPRSVSPRIVSESAMQVEGSRPHRDVDRTMTTPRSPPTYASLPVQFQEATITLKNINLLIAPHAGSTGIFKRIQPHLRGMETLVGFASTSYGACGSETLLGNTITAAIDIRMERCNRALSKLLVQIAWLPYRSFPRLGNAHCVVYEWWTGNELEEIRTIRLSVEEEVRAIGEWLRCLHS